jgi:RNA polymerase sigma factor (sigma-70 family)
VTPKEDEVEPLIDWDAEHAAYMRGEQAATIRLLGLIQEYLPRALLLIDSSLNCELREEIVSRTFTKLHAGGKLKQYRGPNALLGFVRTVLSRERQDLFRERMRRPPHGPLYKRDNEAVQSTTPDHRRPDRALLARELGREIEAAMATLSADERDILERRLISAPPQDYHELAAELGISYGAAQTQFSRARTKLRVELVRRGVHIPGKNADDEASIHA